jgi:hypothetical protein
MTDAEAEALGRRLVACKGFRVMRGMLDMQGRTWGRDLLWRWAPGVDVPDLRDPATLGCLLALVREAWKDLQMCTYGRGLWDVVSKSEEIVTQDWESEAEALVAALESAP